MFKKILIGLVVVIAALCIVVATRPDTLHIERTATVAAPVEFVFPLVNDFHHWGSWSPWEKLDTSMKKEFEGGPGVGAKYHWVGNDKVGEGRMTITESKPNEKVVINLEFLKPFAMTSNVTFTFKPAGPGTQVLWASDGNQNFMAKGYGLFVNMDQLVGKDYEAGLAAMTPAAAGEVQKAVVTEAAMKAAAAAAMPSPSPAPAAPPPPPAKKPKK